MSIIFLVRHAHYVNGGNLSEHGKNQSVELANQIKSHLEGNQSPITIWSSAATRAHQTAEIIQKELQVDELIIENKLWSDNSHEEDFPWLKKKLNYLQGEVLVIVSHLEYVRLFPAKIGYDTNGSDYAEGVKIENNQCTLLRN